MAEPEQWKTDLDNCQKRTAKTLFLFSKTECSLAKKKPKNKNDGKLSNFFSFCALSRVVKFYKQKDGGMKYGWEHKYYTEGY